MQVLLYYNDYNGPEPIRRFVETSEQKQEIYQIIMNSEYNFTGNTGMTFYNVPEYSTLTICDDTQELLNIPISNDLLIMGGKNYDDGGVLDKVINLAISQSLDLLSQFSINTSDPSDIHFTYGGLRVDVWLTNTLTLPEELLIEYNQGTPIENINIAYDKITSPFILAYDMINKSNLYTLVIDKQTTVETTVHRSLSDLFKKLNRLRKPVTYSINPVLSFDTEMYILNSNDEIIHYSKCVSPWNTTSFKTINFDGSLEVKPETRYSTLLNSLELVENIEIRGGNIRSTDKRWFNKCSILIADYLTNEVIHITKIYSLSDMDYTTYELNPNDFTESLNAILADIRYQSSTLSDK